MGRVQERSQTDWKRTGTSGRTIYAYEGSAVRKLEVQPEVQNRITKEGQSASTNTKRNRERALQVNPGYVLFLTVAAVITVWVCVNYLKLQAVNTKLCRNVTSLEASVDAARLENDSDYNRIMTEIDMEHVKDVAMNRLGMVYAKKGQIVTYQQKESDYVRQYTDVPKE